jgi:hypothetical protein
MLLIGRTPIARLAYTIQQGYRCIDDYTMHHVCVFECCML